MNRPEEIKGRIDNIRQIESIVSTLRALAAAHQIEARAHLDAIRSHEATVAGALSVALSLLVTPPARPADRAGDLVLVVGAAQGFSGSYADRLAEAALRETDAGAALMVVGARTLGALDQRPQSPVWSADMVAHAPEVPALAGRMADALFARLADTPERAVRLIFADPATPGQSLIRRTLFPFDFSRFPPSSGASPLVTLPAGDLVAALVEEYVFTELCEALMLGFAAENAARADAMARAQSNVRRIAGDLKGEFQRARQDQMTTEIIELSSGSERPAPSRH
ncbi:F0F1 ATP synthase subunit gamma [Actibacterium sp. D379-3]